MEKILNLEPGYGIPLRPKEMPVSTSIKNQKEGIKNINIKNVDTKIMKDEPNNVRSKEEEYIKEMEKLLKNRNTYSILNKDPTNRLKKLANNLPIKLQNKSIISEEIGKNLRSYNSVAPKLYGF
ncbi:hypothetical protein M0804_014323 [Polistes exclamans]|nr:hypothetical protein M0804_014323 [Polistes exclamans]